MKNLLIILNKDDLSVLKPLVNVWRQKEYRLRFRYYEGAAVPSAEQVARFAKGIDAIMMLVPATRAASTLADGPFIQLQDKFIPIALVPVKTRMHLKTFVDTTVQIHGRDPNTAPVTFLAQKLPRYLKVTRKIFDELNAGSGDMQNFRWTSDVMYAGDMLYGINRGASLCIYMGHGRPSGWAGYYGVRTRHIQQFRHKPSAAIVSLCCWTAARKNVHLSFCEELLLEGLTSSSFGAIKPTLFTDNTRWAINLSTALQNGASTIGEPITAACPVNTKATKYYRLFGDPTTPLYADEHFLTEAQKINTYG